MNTEPDSKNSTADAVSDIEFNDLFNPGDIQCLQDLFSNASGVASLITHPDGTPITQPSNFCRLYNSIILKTEKGRADCTKSYAVFERHNVPDSFVQPCLCGSLWCAGARIAVGGKHIANWLIGQVRNEKFDEQRMIRYAGEIGADREDFMNALAEVPVMPVEQFKKVSALLFAFAKELSEKAYNNFQLKIHIAEREKAITEKQAAQEKIKESEEKFNNLYMNMKAGAALHELTYNNHGDPDDYVIIETNAAFGVQLGIPRDAIVGKTSREAYGVAESPYLETYARVALTGEPIVFETYFPPLSRHFSISAYCPCKGRFITVFEDITERKRTEKELQSKTALFEALVNASLDGILVVDENKKVVLVNQQVVVLFNVPQHVLHIPDHILYDEDDTALLKYVVSLTRYPDQFLEKVLYLYDHVNETSRDEVEFKSGMILDRYSAPVLGKDGKYYGRIWTFRDITERKRTEQELIKAQKKAEAEAQKLEKTNQRLHDEIKEHERLNKKLQESDEEYRTLFESSRDAIMLMDPNTFLDCNKATLDLFNFSSKEEFLTRSPYDLSPTTQPDGRDSLTAAGEHGEKACRDGTDFFEWIHTRQDGTPFYTEVLLSRMEYKGETVLQATIRDITGRKRTEQELIKAQKKAEENAQQQGRIEMANNMLHDIGNALTGISSCMTGPQLEKDWPEIKLLRRLSELFVSAEKELTILLGAEKEKELISLIEALILSLHERNTNNIDFCAKISNAVGHISAVLDLQRYYLKEKSTPSATVFDIKKIIEDALVILSSSLQKRNIQVKINTDGQKTIVSGDQTRIMRLFLNVIKNIYEAFDSLEPAADRKLEISIVSDMEKQEIVIVFLDNGIGFSPETGKKLFERGFTTKQTGSGIGLHQCLSIVESHGGTITIESKGEKTGASTIIKLPFPGKQKG